MRSSSITPNLAVPVLMLAPILLGQPFPASAQSGGGSFTLNPAVVPAGGGSSSNTNRRITGSIGQHATASSSAATFSLNTGFWNAAFPCIGLSRAHLSLAANGGSGSVNILGQSACSWSLVNNNPDFITITSGGGGGSGLGTVSFTVAANTEAVPRSGTITIAGQSFTVFQGIQFNDVPVGHVFYTEIGKLSARRVTLGCDPANYCPDLTVTRQQMAAFIIRALGDFNPPQPAMQRFLDVPPTNPFYRFIEQMALRQITLGCGGGNYCPSLEVSRGQMAAFLVRAFDL